MTNPKTKPLTRAKIRANRKKWLAALRSGEYKQAKGTLRVGSPHGASYCCLGVAEAVCGFPGYEGRNVGLSALQQCFLIEMNDVHNNRFKTVANAIEAMPIVYPEGVK